ncbi:hypothetical protein OP10G_1535 [Fimbriimonas ginsengisoli Gsoil 348]|uniref:Uncharacterized protein n=1 Tax=Fimbriimonas ginsengisoli Gsoil 348 TaxID=661478 RepID=A0A068NMV6_FIMGI|nr:hypothetical protein OP10G_1535 [Fimbriimonas ginsengisoli Gsoil 348]
MCPLLLVCVDSQVTIISKKDDPDEWASQLTPYYAKSN